jgi:phosphoribosyl-ATP pyrophosphohydrolase
VIEKGARGTLFKCKEELQELEDAHEQKNKWHVVVEASDLINSTYTFVWREYKIPFFVVIMIASCTGLYKPIARFLKRK